MLDGYLFAVGGSERADEQSIERYDPEIDSWQLVEADGVVERYKDCSHVVALDGQLYFIGTERIHFHHPGDDVKFSAFMPSVYHIYLGLVRKCTLNALTCSVVVRFFSALGALLFVYSVRGVCLCLLGGVPADGRPGGQVAKFNTKTSQ